MHDQLVKKVNAVFTSKLVNNTYYNAMIKDIENKKASIFNLATIVARDALENKLWNVTDLVKKQMMMWKKKKQRLNISPHLIIISLRMAYLTKR